MKKELVKNQAAYNVTFNYNVVPASPVHSVVVLGDFNEWSMENGYVLKATKSGDFEGKFKIPAGREYHFRYLVNGERWANEKDADRYEASPRFPHIDNSVLSLPAVEEKVIIVKEPANKAAEKKEAAPKKEAVAKKAVKADDLTLIEGIGPKIAEILTAAGVSTFATLGSSKKGELTKLLTAAGSRYAMHDPATWAQQAKLAAAEKWDQLKKLQDELKGGKAK
ncbi:MAG: glycoside hydrolase family 13 [Saprospiraceae bacterium]|nr:glycoside hydrolase family 13 [Saprospiraceae bacterium]